MQPFFGFFLAGVFYLWRKGPKQGQNTPAEGGQAYCRLFLSPSGFSFCMYTTLGQGQEMTLTFNKYIPSYIQLVDCSYQVSGNWLQYFLKKIYCFHFLP